MEMMNNNSEEWFLLVGMEGEKLKVGGGNGTGKFYLMFIF